MKTWLSDPTFKQVYNVHKIFPKQSPKRHYKFGITGNCTQKPKLSNILKVLTLLEMIVVKKSVWETQKYTI